MGRRTISNLIRKTKTSRTNIYNKMSILGIERYGVKGELSEEDWVKLLEVIKKPVKNIRKVKKEEIKIPVVVKEEKKEIKNKIITNESNFYIHDANDRHTISERLENAKKDYNFNQNIIVESQSRLNDVESNAEYYKLLGIIDKYQKQQIQLSKHISELESDLDLQDESEEEAIFQ